jgi:hypothetical protein
MGASNLRRQIRRYFGSVFKSCRGYRWSCNIPLGDGQVEVLDSPVVAEKAVKGAEKSWARSRRKRGLRSGRVRSREGKSRCITVHPTPDSNKCSERVIMRAVRQIEFWQAKTEKVVKRFSRLTKESQWFEEILTRRGEYRSHPRPVWSVFKRAYEQLYKAESKAHRAIKPMLAPSFIAFFSSHIPVTPPEGFGQSKIKTLGEIIEELQFLEEIHEEQKNAPRKVYHERSYARPTWVDNLGSKTRSVVGKPSRASRAPAPSDRSRPKGNAKSDKCLLIHHHGSGGSCVFDKKLLRRPKHRA